MYKLAALDAGFLYAETPRAPQHIASIQILEPPAGTDTGQFVADLKRLLIDRAHLVPYMTNRLQIVPWQLDHPIWVRDAAFDINDHVLQAELPAPGGRAELEAKIAELHARPLDRSKPLWELWVISGLEGGRLAYYNRVHHACLDGVSGQSAVEAIMDSTPEVQPVTPPSEAYSRRPAHRSVLDLLTGAAENFTRFQIGQATATFERLNATLRLVQRAIDPSKGLGAVTESAPRTRFNRSVERQRSYATGDLPLGDMKRIAKATGTTVNDVYIAICGAGIRRYLERAGELPERSLVAGCPVSLRQPGDASSNNQVTMMMVSCATDEPDPVKRLLAVGRSSLQGKGVVAAAAGGYDSNVSLPGLPGLMQGAMQWAESTGLADAAPVPCNVVLSNVPGPRQPLYSLGARVLTHYPVSIPAHGQALNITVQSYVDTLYFAVTACARALPDPQVLRNDILAAFVELRSRAVPASLAPPEHVAEPAPQRALKARPAPLGGDLHAPVTEAA